VSEAARGAPLALEAAQPFGVAAHLRLERFDDDAVAQQDVPPAIDRAHAAAREEGFNLVLPVEHLPDHFRREIFQHFAVTLAEFHRLIVTVAALRTSFHVEIKMSGSGKSRASHASGDEYNSDGCPVFAARRRRAT
jgi:hypothetical protein